MKLHLYTHALVLATGLLFSSYVHAGSYTTCDKVFSDVRAAVTADPSKVLLVVEEAIVANESCACEIVKAAILASKANPDLLKQIVLTATNVAPNMSALIAECATAIAPDHSKQVVDAVMDTVEGPDDYVKSPPDIRGVYLIQPAAGGVVIETPVKVIEKKKIIIREKPPRTSVPQSPSSASHR